MGERAGSDFCLFYFFLFHPLMGHPLQNKCFLWGTLENHSFTVMRATTVHYPLRFWFSLSGHITTRYRHSMTNFPNSSAAPQVSGRTTSVSSSGVGFVPYNKPALSGARSAPRLNAQSSWAFPQAGGAVGPSTGLSTSNGVRYRPRLTFKRCVCPTVLLCSALRSLGASLH